jgi:branched-chain amino acid transport system permease protein
MTHILASAGNRTRLKLGAAVVAIAVAAALPYMVSHYQVTVASLILVSAILATSINFMAGNVGLLSLGHAGIAACAGYGLAWASLHGFGLGGQLLIALGLTIVSSFVFGITSMRTNGIFFLMATLALGMVVFGLSYRMAPITGGENGLSGIRRPSLFAEYWTFYFAVLAVFALVTLVVWTVGRSPFGITLRSIRESESRAESLGYNVAAYKLGAMMISGLVAGVAGIFAVWSIEFVSPASGSFVKSALAALMVILGGVGTLLGPIIGATVVLGVEHILSSYIERWPTVLGLIFIVVIIYAPNGLGGVGRDVRKWRDSRKQRRQAPEKVLEPTSVSARDGSD